MDRELRPETSAAGPAGPWQRGTGLVPRLSAALWRWVPEPKINRRRRVAQLLAWFCVSGASVGLSGWLFVQENWVVGAYFFIGGLAGITEGLDAAWQWALEDLGVPKRTSPRKVVDWSPPGSRWRLAAERAARLHTMNLLVKLAAFLALMAVFVSRA